MNKPFLAVVSALSLLLATGCATGPDKAAMSEKPAKTMADPRTDLEVRDKITATAIVQAVDLENREVVLKGKGGFHVVKVGEEVRNLPQVKPGDRVVLTYYEALAVSLDKNVAGGVASRKETVTTDRAELGQKPAGTVRKDTEIVANVAAINKQTRRVTLQGPQRRVTVKAPDDLDISKLKVGDQVKASYVQELAVSVEPAKTKKK